MLTLKTKFKILFIGITFLVTPFFVQADYLGQKVNFFVESSYDLNKREQVSATLQKSTDQLYFYIDDSWWSSMDYQKKQDIEKALDSLASEFQSRIYPALTSNFGFEWKLGIDKEEAITILLHPMREELGGYFRSGDEYPRLQVSRSNEKEMLYLNTDYITSPLAKSFLAHEFIHLITFNQKEKIHGVEEETWLNEARAEYVSTLLGYDNEYRGSNLQKRVNVFLEEPSDSITEWKNEKADYGALNLFTQYLVDHYGVKILTDSLKSKETGIKSLNEALAKNGSKEDFSQIFVNWTITVIINDCSLGEKYCYLNQNLNNLLLTPVVNFLPMSGDSTLSVSTDTKDWAGNWYRFIGGRGFLKLEFAGSSWVNFKVPYLIKDIQGDYSLNFIGLDENQKGEISVPDFGEENIFLTIIPSVQNKISGFSSDEPSYSFFWSASVIKNTQEEKEKQEAELIKKLLDQIESLKKEIARVQAEIDRILGRPATREIPAGFTFNKNLNYGMFDPDVVYLKIILDAEVTHEVWTGSEYFGSKTLSSVKAFQQKYKEDISEITGYEISCTGFIGEGTKAKLNEILGNFAS